MTAPGEAGMVDVARSYEIALEMTRVRSRAFGKAGWSSPMMDQESFAFAVAVVAKHVEDRCATELLSLRSERRRLRRALDEIGEAIAKGWTHDALVISEEALHPPRARRAGAKRKEGNDEHL